MIDDACSHFNLKDFLVSIIFSLERKQSFLLLHITGISFIQYLYGISKVSYAISTNFIILLFTDFFMLQYRK